MLDFADWLGRPYHAFAENHPKVAAEGVLETIEDRAYVDFLARGVSFTMFDLVTIGCVHFYCEGHEGHSGYAGPLPLGLSFGMSRSAVRTLLGIPTWQRGTVVLPVLGESPPLDRYDLADGGMAVRYTPDEAAIQTIALWNSSFSTS